MTQLYSRLSCQGGSLRDCGKHTVNTNASCHCFVQDPEKRPQVTEVKDVLLEFARLHFNNQSPAEAMALKHAKERALLDQILPPKVRTGRP